MSEYRFESVSEAGFIISGLLEADDEREARVRALRFCGTSDSLRVLEAVPVRADPPDLDSRGAGGRDAENRTSMGVLGLAATVWRFFRGKRSGQQ